MSIQAMTRKKFRSLKKRDFENGAITSEIDVALEQRERLIYHCSLVCGPDATEDIINATWKEIAELLKEIKA